MILKRSDINKMHIWTAIIFLYFNAHVVLTSDEGPLLTQTIYGFLDFTTTIGNTVMVFSPQSAPALVIKPEVIAPIIKTKPEKVSPITLDGAISPTKLKTAVIKSITQSTAKLSENNIKAPNAVSVVTSSSESSLESINNPQNLVTPSNIVKTSLTIENHVQGPEYDLLSRQPPQFIEETFRVVNLKSNNNKNSRTPVVVTPEKSTASSSGTSSTKIPSRSHKNKKNKVRPSSTLQILKTAAPVAPQKHSTSNKVTLRNTSTSSSSTSRKSSKKGSNHRGATSTTSQPEDVFIVKSTTTRNKPKRKNKHKNLTTNKPRYSTTTSATTTEPTVRRAFRPKLQVSNPDLDANNNLHITKLNRTPGRWQYKTSPKPRVNIRKPAVEANGSTGLSNVTSLINSNLSVLPDAGLGESLNGNFLNQNVIYNQSDLEISGSQNGPILNNIDQEGKQNLFTETINVEISTPVDFKDTYYEIATIKKPFIFQAGVLKKTRFITVTSTIEKYLTPEPSLEPRSDDEPLTENILAGTTSRAEGILSGSITTLPPIYINDGSDTPVLETVTESFSIVNKKLKTQILPIINENDNDTTYHTLVQTIDLTSLITVTKTTLPQLETKEFNGFKDFVGNLDEAGSEINLDLEFGDEGNQENGSSESNKNDFDLAPLNKTIKQNHATAFTTSLLTLPSQNIITNSRPVVKLETLWESYVVPITNGQSTTFRTLSKAKGVVERTDYIIDTTTLSVPPPLIPQQSTINPFLLPIPQQFQTITSPIVQQTIVTQTESKVLKLTFGAKTAYTTLYSTQVVPTVQTMYVTTSVPVQPTANPFQGFFPQPYNPFAYLG